MKKYNYMIRVITLNLIFMVLLSYGCKKDPGYPSIELSEITNITGTTAITGGEITAEGESPVIERGVCWNTSKNPTIGDSKTSDGEGSGAFISEISGLEPGKIYYVRAYATNENGTGYSTESTFNSLVIVPILSTSNVTSINTTSANCGGIVSNDGGSPVTARGVCWGVNPNPTIADTKTSDGSGLGTFTSSITGLVDNSAYFVRAYATNNVGTGYGPSVLLSTVPGITFNSNLQYNTMTDIDGNIYKTIEIGNQVWMAENLKVSRYRNGDSIPIVVDSSKWVGLSSGASCHYNQNLGYMPVYGKLYNWHVTEDIRKIAPDGWHIPTEGEWEILINYLSNMQGNKLREKGSKHWKSPNTSASNESGFTALPAGFRYRNLGFDDLSFSANWWSASGNGTYATMFTLGYNQESMIKNLEYKINGYAIRCVKD